MRPAVGPAGDYPVKAKSASGFALIDLLFVVGIIGILCGIAIPRLMAAKGSAQSTSAIASLRVIGSAQVAFAITCGSGFYAPTLTKLAKPPVGTVDGFIKADLGAADTMVKSGYQVKLSTTPYGGAPDTCNALGVGQTGLAYKAGTSDWRESPAITVGERLTALGAEVRAHDAHVPEGLALGPTVPRVEYSVAEIEAADLVVLLTDHPELPYDEIAARAQLVLDTRGRLRDLEFRGETL